MKLNTSNGRKLCWIVLIRNQIGPSSPNQQQPEIWDPIVSSRCWDSSCLSWAQGGAQDCFPGHAPTAWGVVPSIRGLAEDKGRSVPIYDSGDQGGGQWQVLYATHSTGVHRRTGKNASKETQEEGTEDEKDLLKVKVQCGYLTTVHIWNLGNLEGDMCGINGFSPRCRSRSVVEGQLMV